jgi:hypothetical protein
MKCFLNGQKMPKFFELYVLYNYGHNERASSQTYLLRGMCSNGPEVGIVPHKSLLETSLK